MKKKIFAITSIILIIGILCSVFVGCKSAEEKEKEYYEKGASSIESATNKLSLLTDEVFSKPWTSSFVLAMTYYKTESEKTYKDGREKEEFTTGSVYGSSIQRGSKEQAGWPVKTIENDEFTQKNSTDQYVYFMAFDVDFKSLDNYTVKTTLFKDVKRSDYNNKISKKNYREKFDIEKQFEYSVKDGVESGELNQGINPIEVIQMNTDKETIKSTGISASDNFRIYTHFMRIESRMVFGENNTLITKELNDQSDKKYWKNFGEDISYDWNNVYSMNNNRLTVLYSKGKNRINSLEIYNENVLSYYTKNNNVDTSLVLKADVIAYTEMVVEFKY